MLSVTRQFQTSPTLLSVLPCFVISTKAGAMATSSSDDIPAQLAALLGNAVTRLRITDEVPPRISAIDLATAITRKGANKAAEQVAYVKKRHPEGHRNFR